MAIDLPCSVDMAAAKKSAGRHIRTFQKAIYPLPLCGL